MKKTIKRWNKDELDIINATFNMYKDDKEMSKSKIVKQAVLNLAARGFLRTHDATHYKMTTNVIGFTSDKYRLATKNKYKKKSKKKTTFKPVAKPLEELVSEIETSEIVFSEERVRVEITIPVKLYHQYAAKAIENDILNKSL